MLENIKEFFSNYGAIIIIAILLIVILVMQMKKNHVLKVVFMTVLMFVAIGSACYSIYQLHGYYSAKGEIHGTISGANGTTVLVEDMKFNFLNMELKQNENGEYEAIIESEAVFDIEKKNAYEIFVGDEPCQIIEYGNDYVLATYSYNFYDKESKCVVNDILTFRFSFFEKKTTFSIATNGNADAVKYWNQYFNNNNFVVEIKLAEEIYTTGNELTYSDEVIEDASEYVLASFVVESTCVSQKLVIPGSTIDFPKLNSHVYGYWSVDGVNRITSDYSITETTIFYAMRYTEEEYCQMALSNMQDGVLDLSVYPLYRVPAQMFIGNKDIKSVKFPETLKIIESMAFTQTGLTSVTMPNSLEEIHNGAFLFCNLKSISLNEGLKKMGSYLFGTTELTQILLPSTLEQISVNLGSIESDFTQTFFDCENLVINCNFNESDKSFVENWNSNGNENLEVKYLSDNDEVEKGDQGTENDDGKREENQDTENPL